VKRVDVVYARVSTEEQKRNETVKGQISEVTKHAAAKGATIAKVYADEGVSGSKPLAQRPEGAELLRDAEAGTIGSVFVWRFDRLGRNLRDFLNVHEQLERFGVTIVSVTQPLPEGPAGTLMLQVLGAFAQLDRTTIVENMKRGHAAKVAAGGFRGGRFAFGYRVEGQQRTARLVPDPKHAAIVRWMFEMYDAGKSLTDLANDLNTRGVPTPRGAPVWRPSAVRVVLRNRVYVKDIVPVELFERVQQKLAANQSLLMAHPKNDYLLRSKIRCECGCGFLGRGRYYSCVGRHCGKRLYGNTRQPCTAPILRRADIDAAVWDRIASFLKKPGAVLRELERQMAIESHPVRVSEMIREAQRERSQQAAKLERIQLLYVEGEIDREKRREMTAKVATATAAIDARIAGLRRERASLDTAALGLADARDVLADLAGVAANPSPAQKRKAVEALVDGITVGKDGKVKIAFVFEPQHTRSANGYASAICSAIFQASSNGRGPLGDSPSTSSITSARSSTPYMCAIFG
jgi:DNA invertase Pin-like site-specific DNA recombinase